MAKKKSKGKQQKQTFLSPERFIKERMRSVEIGDCYVDDNIFKVGCGNVLVSRKHTGGNISFGVFLVDTWCLGVKKSSYRLRVDEDEFDGIVENCMNSGMRKASYDEVHNIVYGAIAYAEEAGIQPCKEFSLGQYFLEEDTEDVPLIEYEFGKDGEHYLVANNSFEANRYLPVLEKNLGNNFDWIIMDDMDDDDDDDDYDEDDDDDYDEDYEDYDAAYDDAVGDDYDDEELDDFYVYNGFPYTYHNDNLPTEIKLENKGLFSTLSLKKNRIALSEEDSDRILAMPHDSLKRDLEKIILYGLRVMRDDSDSVRTYNSYARAVAHAVLLLSEVGDSETSLDAVLETLKIDLGTYDDIYGDGDGCYLFPALIKLGKDALPKLETFLYGKGFFVSKKSNVMEAMVNIACRWEDKKPEVMEILKKFLAKALSDGDKSMITNYGLNGMLVWALCDLRVSQLMPMIERLYKENLIDKRISDSLESVRRDICRGEKYDNLYELGLRDCYAGAIRMFGR